MRLFENGPKPTLEGESKRVEIPLFNPERAENEERSIFERLRGKAKEVAGVMLLMTALSLGPGLVRESLAEQSFKKEATMEKTSNEQAAKERAVNYLERLSRVKSPENVNEAQGKIMADRAARVIINSFAAQEKVLATGGSEDDIKKGVLVTPQDIQNTLNQLNSAINDYADRYLGNKDGKSDEEEMKAFKKKSSENPGFKTLVEMNKQYK